MSYILSLCARCYVLLTISAGAGLAQSPLETVMDGRSAATTSTLTESGMTTLAQTTANIVMFTCGAVAIILTALGLYELYKAAEGDSMMGGRQANKSSAIWKIGLAGAVSVPAIIAAIFPHVVLGP